MGQRSYSQSTFSLLSLHSCAAQTPSIWPKKNLKPITFLNLLAYIRLLPTRSEGFKWYSSGAERKISLRRFGVDVYGWQRAFLVKLLVVWWSLPPCQDHLRIVVKVNKSCLPVLASLFDSGNLSNPSSNATFPTFMDFITQSGALQLYTATNTASPEQDGEQRMGAGARISQIQLFYVKEESNGIFVKSLNDQ